MAYFFLIAFFVASAIHLVASNNKDTHLRDASKIFLVPCLLEYYVLSADVVSMYFVAFLVCNWVGDILLTLKGNRWLIYGGIAFFCGHALLCILIATNMAWSARAFIGLVAAAVVFAVAVVFVRKHHRSFLARTLQNPATLYLATNALSNCFAFAQLIANPCLGSVALFVGTALFFVSDSILFSVRFNNKSFFKTHTVVMLTYLLAMLFITFGFLQLY